MIGKNLILKGIAAGSRRMLDDFVKAAETAALRPHIDRTFAFAEAKEAYAYLQSGGHLGKVMIDVGGA